MFNISSFLEKFSKNINSQESNLKLICDVIFKKTGIICDPKSIKIQNNVLYLDVSPAVKNKIFISKKTIIDDIMKFTQINIIDIR